MAILKIARWGLGAAAASGVGYLGYDRLTMTVGRQLSEEGYELNPPKFTNHENLDHGCFEALFKEDPNFDQNKLYGCGVAQLDSWNSGTQFSSSTPNKTVDYLLFNSEISMRKGDKGWKINTKFDNKSGVSAEYSHYVTTYRKNSNKVWEEQDTFFIAVDAYPDETEGLTFTTTENNDNKEYKMFLGKQNLNIKVPGENGNWYNNKDYFFTYMEKSKYSGPSERKGLTEDSKQSKSWSGMWVEDSEESSSWIFKDLEIFVGEKKYSKFFCKNEEQQTDGCLQRKITTTGKTEGEENDVNNQEITDDTQIYIKGKDSAQVLGTVGTWGYVKNSHNEPKPDEEGENQSTDLVKDKVSPIIEGIKGSKGKWVNLSEVCGISDEIGAGEDQLKNMKLFCAKPRS